ncbi:MAG: LamB/YcsF family protein [Janthinobacterium lividum]
MNTQPIRCLDLNADLGESFGVYTLGDDDSLLRSVTSANIACGFHAGDPGTMAQAVESAVAHNVALGAHPGLPDLAGFGRRCMAMTPPEVRDLVTYQIGALAGFAARQGQTLRHVKPHGALYAMAEDDDAIAEAIALAVREWDTKLILFGLSGGSLVKAGKALGLQTASEIFADRAYYSNGTLAPRSEPNAVLHDLEEVAARMSLWAREGRLTATDGTVITLDADTVCLHGDSPNASALAARVRQVLEAEGIMVQAPKPS